jgi:hypothetical protein
MLNFSHRVRSPGTLAGSAAAKSSDSNIATSISQKLQALQVRIIDTARQNMLEFAILLVFQGAFGIVIVWRIWCPPRQRNLRFRCKGVPITAEFLFHLFLSPEDCDALVGDLEERYRLIAKKFGRRRANFWYWVQTFISLRPIIWAAAKRVSGLVTMIEAWRRIRG